MKKLILTTIAIFALVGCGGGGGNNPSNTNTQLASGSLDKNFGTNGVKKVALSTDDGFTDLKCRMDNSIIGVYSKEKANSSYDGVIALYKEDGTLNSSFGNSNGEFITGLANDDKIAKIAVDSNGNIYAVGFVQDSNSKYQIMVLKLDSSGHLDTNFASSGYFTIGGNGKDVWGRAIAIHNNKI